MTDRLQQLREANEDKKHLQEMCEKLVFENVRLNKKLKALSKQIRNNK